MRYFNESDVKNYSERKSVILENCDINKASYISSIYSVFLSHSSKDKPSLKGVIAFLKSFGADVYIDLNDITLPAKPSTETAQKLKVQMKKCSKVIVLVSENSRNSKWIPWEVGLADMDKTPKKLRYYLKQNMKKPNGPNRNIWDYITALFIMVDYGMFKMQKPAIKHYWKLG